MLKPLQKITKIGNIENPEWWQVAGDDAAGGGFGQLFGVGKSCEWFLSIAMFDYQRGIAVMNKI